MTYTVKHIKESTGSALLCGNGTGEWIVINVPSEVTLERLARIGVCEACVKVLLGKLVDNALVSPAERAKARLCTGVDPALVMKTLVAELLK